METAIRKPTAGKTKLVTPVEIRQVIMKHKDAVTWGNKYSEDMPGKAIWANTTTCNVFQALSILGSETAFIGQESATELRAWDCDMHPLEIVVRFWNDDKGSFKACYPSIPIGPLQDPTVQSFLKSSGEAFEGTHLPGDDPLITTVQEDAVWVYRAGKPIVGLGTYVPFKSHAGDLRLLISQMQQRALEDATKIRDLWKAIGWTLKDVKLEYGRTLPVQENRRWVGSKDVLADVVDNDSWRILDPDGNERSKQNVRDKKSIAGAEVDYLMVAEASKLLPDAAKKLAA